MKIRDRRLAGAALLALLSVTGTVLDLLSPAWLRKDPLLEPFGITVAAPDTAGSWETDAASEGPAVVSLDTATVADLTRLPGIGPVTARRILELRDLAGPYRMAEDLLEVKGIGPARLERLRPWLSFGAPGRTGADSISTVR